MKTYSITTTYGDTAIHEVGDGEPLVVFHGGPGLNSSYLLKPLTPLSEWRRLIFFDQLGCSGNYTSNQVIDSKKTLDHAEEVLKRLDFDGGVGFLAHSWGTYLALGCLAKIRPSDMILMNPFPLTLNHFLKMNERMNGITKNLLSDDAKMEKQRLEKIGTVEIGKAYMKLVAPLYVADPENAKKLSFDFYNPKIESSVFSSMENFDLTPMVGKLPARTLILLGEKDFIQPDDLTELVSSSVKIETLPGVGHSPFVESPKQFIDVLGKFLS
jgi:proline iminopeptidase